MELPDESMLSPRNTSSCGVDLKPITEMCTFVPANVMVEESVLAAHAGAQRVVVRRAGGHFMALWTATTRPVKLNLVRGFGSPCDRRGIRTRVFCYKRRMIANAQERLRSSILQRHTVTVR